MSLANMCSLPLSELGIRENTVEENLQRQLQEQIMHGDREALEYMVKLGLKWEPTLIAAKETPLHYALNQKDLELFESLLKIQNLLHLPNDYGETPLHLACRLGLSDVASTLLEAGADMNAKDCEHNTPLYHAVYKHRVNCVKLLIKAGCDLDMLNKELMAPLDCALLYRDHAVVALLLRAGVETRKLQGHIYYRDHYSNSFFHALWSDSTLDNMKLFLNCGYDPGVAQLISLKLTSERLHGPDSPVYRLLKEYTEKPQSLMWRCRRSIRQALMKTRCERHIVMDDIIMQLPVASVLKQFLLVAEDEDENQTCL